MEEIIRNCLIEFGGNRAGLAWEDASLSQLFDFIIGKAELIGLRWMTVGSCSAAANRFYVKHGFHKLEAPLAGSEHYACDAWYIREL